VCVGENGGGVCRVAVTGDEAVFPCRVLRVAVVTIVLFYSPLLGGLLSNL
jgi:hypothetical protein